MAIFAFVNPEPIKVCPRDWDSEIPWDTSVIVIIDTHGKLILHFSFNHQSLEMNWRSGKHSLQKIVCRSENIKGVYCLQYDEQKIVSGLRDNTIKVG